MSCQWDYPSSFIKFPSLSRVSREPRYLTRGFKNIRNVKTRRSQWIQHIIYRTLKILKLSTQYPVKGCQLTTLEQGWLRPSMGQVLTQKVDAMSISIASFYSFGIPAVPK